MNLQRKVGETMHLIFKEAVVLKGPKPQYQNFTSHLLLLYKLFISKAVARSCHLIHCLIMSLILVTTLFNRVMTLQGEIWCW